MNISERLLLKHPYTQQFYRRRYKLYNDIGLPFDAFFLDDILNYEGILYYINRPDNGLLDENNKYHFYDTSVLKILNTKDIRVNAVGLHIDKYTIIDTAYSFDVDFYAGTLYINVNTIDPHLVSLLSGFIVPYIDDDIIMRHDRYVEKILDDKSENMHYPSH